MIGAGNRCELRDEARGAARLLGVRVHPQKSAAFPAKQKPLLPQPGGFEGGFSTRERLAAHEPFVADRPEPPYVPAGLDAAMLATSPQRHCGQDLISCVGQLDLSARTLEPASQPFRKLDPALRPPEDAAFRVKQLSVSRSCQTLGVCAD